MMKKYMALFLTLLMIITITACGKDVSPISGKSASAENGVINLDGVTVSFGENSVPDGESAILKIIKGTDIEAENGLSSELYELILTEAIQIRLKSPCRLPRLTG